MTVTAVRLDQLVASFFQKKDIMCIHDYTRFTLTIHEKYRGINLFSNFLREQLTFFWRSLKNPVLVKF